MHFNDVSIANISWRYFTIRFPSNFGYSANHSISQSKYLRFLWNLWRTFAHLLVIFNNICGHVDQLSILLTSVFNCCMERYRRTLASMGQGSTTKCQRYFSMRSCRFPADPISSPTNSLNISWMARTDLTPL